MYFSVFCLFFVVLIISNSNVVNGFSSESFTSSNWIPDVDHKNHVHTFKVALKLRNRDELLREFHAVSNPRHSSYGNFLSISQIRDKYGPKDEDVFILTEYFSRIPGSKVEMNLKGDFLSVSAPVSHIEQYLGTKLMWHKHIHDGTSKRSLRTVSDFKLIPEEISSRIAFMSLNSPINHMVPTNDRVTREKRAIEENDDITISVTPGNKEALLRFQPICGDGLVNTMNPPCSSLGTNNIPSFKVTVTQHANNLTNPYVLTTDPTIFELNQEYIFCYNNQTKLACTGPGQFGYCTCVAKISPLPMYIQLLANMTSTFPNDTQQVIGRSSLFVNTDVATISFLSSLYNVPAGQTVRNKESTQAVAEFYGEYYSNKDLATFFYLSGLPQAQINATTNILYGTNDESEPGGEAQLDVEYLMGLAPGAETYFYSVSALNPYDSENEGFLTWLYVVGNETNPPLVQSLSYGDIEVSVFPPNNTAAYDYGTRCDEEFMLLGLRGISILVSSGDDGIGGYTIREDPVAACSQAWPEWPAGSPYITSIGATQLTDTYLPGCGQPYGTGMAANSGIPPEAELLFQCTGTRETVCSAITGGVITSGGGFSNVYERATTVSYSTFIFMYLFFIIFYYLFI